MPITREKIQEVADKIAKEFKPEKIILFGSFAWGTPTEESDFDLFIIKDTDERRVERERRVRKVIWGSGMPIDLLVYTPEEVTRRKNMGDFFISDILSRGQVLYTA